MQNRVANVADGLGDTRVSRQRLNRAEISSRLSPGAITRVISVVLLIGSAPHQVELADEVNKGLVRFHASLPEGHGYTQPVGEHLKYLVCARGRPVACVAWSSAPRHLGSRDRFIGWGLQARRQNIGLLAYNTRFLILPWVTVPHLASHILGRMARTLSVDWQCLYGHPIYFIETFIDPQRFRGTCYRAANWTLLGVTTGRGKDAPTHQANRSIKQVLGYALVKDFRQRLSQVA